MVPSFIESREAIEGVGELIEIESICDSSSSSFSRKKILEVSFTWKWQRDFALGQHIYARKNAK